MDNFFADHWILINLEFYILNHEKIWILFYLKRRREYSQVLLDICEYDKHIIISLNSAW